MKYLLFTLVTLMCSVCFGQVPISKDRVLILVTNHDDNSLYQDAERHFKSKAVRSFMKTKGIQFIHMYGNDTTGEWRKQNKITHYPAVVYYMKAGDGYKLVKTVSGDQTSRLLGKEPQVRNLLGMKAETYRAPPQNSPSNHPYIPGPKSPPQQFVSPPRQPISQPPVEYAIPMPQYNMPQQYSAPSS